jgi:hypothetical protein
MLFTFLYDKLLFKSSRNLIKCDLDFTLTGVVTDQHSLRIKDKTMYVQHTLFQLHIVQIQGHTPIFSAWKLS